MGTWDDDGFNSTPLPFLYWDDDGFNSTPLPFLYFSFKK